MKSMHGFQSIAPSDHQGAECGRLVSPSAPLVTYERMFRNRVHVTRCTRRAVTLFRLEEPPPARHGATAATDTGRVGSCSRHHSRHHSCLASTVQSAAQLQHTSYTPDS